MESAAGGELDLSPAGIKDRVSKTAADLHEVVKKHLGDTAELHDLADQIVKQGKESLDILANENRVTAELEVIVRVDGSRPSFMVRDGKVDRTTSPVGAWSDVLDTSEASQLLDTALACVGRIDVPELPQGFAGTGFLIHENLIITNRHVLQAIARPDEQGVFVFKPGVVIDFGHEFRARASISPRKLKQVVFCPPKFIDPNQIDHTKLDLVVIELEPVTSASDRPRSVLAFDTAPDWAQPSQFVYVVGYPGSPGFAESLTLQEQLFKSTYGYKRLAPGQIITPASTVSDWTLTHDATTLGGNSGSLVVVPGREGNAVGLHYGGTRGQPRENWGHILGRVLDGQDKTSSKTLREVLKAFGVNVNDGLLG
ncbi:MAG: trypsin-like peptidase domain-containing protein [Nitrospira sp.]|nr:trypsin-like peptidase domain-containing protein [Nitrospira sp.]